MRAALSSQMTTKLHLILMVRYVIPLIYLLYMILIWQESTECYNRIFLVDVALIYVLVVCPRRFLKYDTIIVLLFFMWVIEDDNSTVNLYDTRCLATNNKLFLSFSLILFQKSLTILNLFAVILLIYLAVSLIKDFLRHPRVQGNGLPEEEIERLPTIRYDEELSEKTQEAIKDEICPICLESYQKGEELKIIPICKHRYHPNCIKVWLSSNAICPYCRTLIPFIGGDGEEPSPLLNEHHVSLNIDQRTTNSILTNSVNLQRTNTTLPLILHEH